MVFTAPHITPHPIDTLIQLCLASAPLGAVWLPLLFFFLLSPTLKRSLLPAPFWGQLQGGGSFLSLKQPLQPPLCLEEEGEAGEDKSGGRGAVSLRLRPGGGRGERVKDGCAGVKGGWVRKREFYWGPRSCQCGLPKVWGLLIGLVMGHQVLPLQRFFF